MPRKNKIVRPTKRYECEKCGRKAAVKHDKGRFRCLECHSIYGPNSRKGCYNKKEYLVLKTFLELFGLVQNDDRKNRSMLLKEFVKTVEEQNINDVKKLVEINVINKIDIKEELRILETDAENLIVIARCKNNRFRVYKNFFKPDKEYVFNNRTIKIRSNGRFDASNKYHELQKKVSRI